MWHLNDFYSRFGVLFLMLIHCSISYTYLLFYNMFFPILHIDALLRGLALQLTTVYGVPLSKPINERAPAAATSK